MIHNGFQETESPQLSRAAKTGVVVVHERSDRANNWQGVIVRAAYPPGKFRDAVISAVFGVGGMVAILFVAFGWMFGRSMQSLFLLFPLFPVAVITPLIISRISRLAQTYVFEADGDGIAIHRSRGRREWTTRLPREQITDVRLGFGTFGGRHGSGRSTAWLIIALAPPHRFNERLLHDFGGDQLARVADALRAGIGLPPRSWP